MIQSVTQKPFFYPHYSLHFRKQDYALFQHIMWYNIGEESRHLEEWDALQNLPPEELEELKKNIMVHFGYDKKDGPPTTYNFVIKMPSIILHFGSLESKFVADVHCSELKWSLRKLNDRISHQKLTLRSIELIQTSGDNRWAKFEKLLIPSMNFDPSLEKEAQLIYTSTSRPRGDQFDNVKYLEVNGACIYFIYP